ncbi:MAG: ABC transporter permease subunit [Clostridiales bacterium]|nr:ABC transporter permease subunit [Clostridiales bacterium]
MVKNRYRIIFVMILLIVWETVVKLELFSVIAMPSLMTIIKAFIFDIDDILVAVLNSFLVIGEGFVISAVLALILVVMSRHPILNDLIEFLITIFHPLPGVALLPLILLWVGAGRGTILVIVVHAILWPLLINVKQEVQRIHHDYGQLIHVFSIPRSQRWLRIYMPGSLPGIISGSKIGWSRGWRGFISAEMIFSIVGKSNGVGWLIAEKRYSSDTPGLFAGILAIILCSLVVERYVFNTIEKKTIKKWA